MVRIPTKKRTDPDISTLKIAHLKPYHYMIGTIVGDEFVVYDVVHEGVSERGMTGTNPM